MSADVGSVGFRRLPGNAASTVPTAIKPDPIHSHKMSGLINTLIRASLES